MRPVFFKMLSEGTQACVSSAEELRTIMEELDDPETVAAIVAEIKRIVMAELDHTVQWEREFLED